MLEDLGKGYKEEEYKNEKNSIRTKLLLGLGFLIFGFALQIIGNWLQYLAE